MKTKNLFDLDKTIAKELLSYCEYPWEALSKIKEHIIFLGGKLDKALFDEISPGVWVSKSAEIATSIIMRTTITQNIKVTVNGTDKPIYVVESNIEQLVSYDNLAIYYNVMTSDELVDVIASVNVLLGGNSGFEVSLDLATLISASSNIDTLLGSDVMIIAVSEYLLDNYGMYCHSFEKETLPSLVELPSGNKVANKEVLTKTSIISIINLLKSFAG